MYIARFLLIFVVVAFTMFFFWKTLLLTPYFRNRERVRKILRTVLLIALSAFTAWLVIVFLMELR